MTRWIAPGGVVLGSLLLCGCSAVGTPEPACRPLEVAEFPLLGGIRGTWMDAERFVLADLHQSRLLVYSTSEGLVRIVNGWETEDPELSVVSPADIEPWGSGFLVVDSFRRVAQLFELDMNLRPLRLLWEGDSRRTENGWEGEEITNIDDLVTLRDNLYVQGDRITGPESANREYAEFAVEPGVGGVGRRLREVAAWPGFEGELYWYGSLHDLATTAGRAASAFALRFSAAEPFVQELAGDGRRLEAFPDLPAPMPVLPRGGPEELDAFYAALEASSYPAGLYGAEDSLYVLMRDATGGEPVWDLHRIDPQRDEVIGRVRLPTKAAHVSLLPGRRHWVLEEASSGLEGLFRPPVRFLLLSSAALRAGEVPSCD
ncbi:MAG: hypothetical protein F4060_06160 [Holophagales bacterium]|nr:hypothetical protein [Holophagales bacterium]MYG31661.1 hypothetical protein [Holophagales bacterium]MYI79503.1 hypothetical protein [Holophagales bacterium]